MTAEVYMPAALLKDFVKQVVVLDNYAPGTRETSLPYFADGLPGIMYHQCDNGMYLNRSKRLSHLFIYGQTVKPIEINVTGSFRIILFYLYPHVAKVLFQQNSGEITDTCLDLTLLNRFGLNELIVRLEDSASARLQVDLINNFLVAHIYRNNLTIDKGLDFAVRQIVQANSLASLKDIRRQLNISERTFDQSHFIRSFREFTGYTPSGYFEWMRHS